MGSRRRRWINTAIRYGLLVAGLIYIFHGIDFERLEKSLRGIACEWVIIGAAASTASFIFQGFRWKWLLLPVAKISTFQAMKTVYAGKFANDIMPMRLGELFKAYMATQWVRIDFVSALPTVIAERTMDGIWTVTGVLITAFFVGLPRELLVAVYVLGGIIVLGATAFFYASFFRNRVIMAWSRKKPAGYLEKLKALLGKLIIGFRRVILTPFFFPSFTVSVFFLLLEAVAFWLMTIGYRLHLSFWQASSVFFICHMGTIIPSTPGSVGVYQFFCVLGLGLFSIGKAEAAGFSIVSYVFLRLPLWVIGFIAISRSKLRISEIGEKIDEFKSTRRKKRK